MKMKRRVAWALMVAMVFQFSVIETVSAAGAGDVVINEIAWMGTADNSNDEWIELYNTSAQAIDLSGWVIDDDNASAIYTIDSGVIEARGYFLIEDNEDSVSNVTADIVIGLSLANTGDSLLLKNAAGDIIDEVNTGGGAWYAGDSTSKASMERIDPGLGVDSADNWADAVFENGAVGSLGSQILGSPGSVNSNFAGDGFEVSLISDSSFVQTGDALTVTAQIASASDMYAYGFDLVYDAQVLNFVSASSGGFLASDGAGTSFFSALENGVEGTLIVGDSRLVSPASGVDGGGDLFSVVFDVVGGISSSSDISFVGASFVADSVGDVAASYGGISVLIEDGTVNEVSDVQVVEGAERHSLRLDWSGDADSYTVSRELVNGAYMVLGETSDLFFVDSGADLLPSILYSYRVTAVKNGIQSLPMTVSGDDSRGVSGDNDRSDRVDGRDIERLARSYGSSFGEDFYDALTDSSFDGIVDGSDLIDIGANFGLSY